MSLSDVFLFDQDEDQTPAPVMFDPSNAPSFSPTPSGVLGRVGGAALGLGGGIGGRTLGNLMEGRDVGDAILNAIGAPSQTPFDGGYIDTPGYGSGRANMSRAMSIPGALMGPGGLLMGPAGEAIDIYNSPINFDWKGDEDIPELSEEGKQAQRDLTGYNLLDKGSAMASSIPVLGGLLSLLGLVQGSQGQENTLLQTLHEAGGQFEDTRDPNDTRGWTPPDVTGVPWTGGSVDYDVWGNTLGTPWANPDTALDVWGNALGTPWANPDISDAGGFFSPDIDADPDVWGDG
tara:strand:+ start:172 stop:1041 length:870 start_codon:yes stop_codon:yes gene_type:complete